MASCFVNRSCFICVSECSINVWSIGGTQFKTYRCEKLKKNKEEDDNKSPSGSDLILACTLSPSGKYFATCDDYKQLTIWDTHGEDGWVKLNTRLLVRRVTSLTFDPEENHVILASKSGDVYQYPRDVPESSAESGAQETGKQETEVMEADDDEEIQDGGKLLLGHISMVLDLSLCGTSFLATSDRDEKIRISCYPNCYNIQAFCLGHTEFVSQLVYVQKYNVLLSAGGDCTVKLWSCDKWTLLHSDDLLQHIHDNKDALPGNEPVTLDNSQDVRTRHERHSELLQKQQEKSRTDVRCLRYNDHHDMVALSFESFPYLLIYTLSSNETHALTLNHLQTIPVKLSPMSLTFDHEGRLWTTQSVEGQCLQMYEVLEKDNTKVLSPVELDASESLHRTMNSVNQQWDMFKDLSARRQQFPMLHKPKLDNVKQYLETKQQRIEEIKKQRQNKPLVTPGDDSNQQSEENDAMVTPVEQNETPECKKQKVE